MKTYSFNIDENYNLMVLDGFNYVKVKNLPKKETKKAIKQYNAIYENLRIGTCNNNGMVTIKNQLPKIP